MRVKQKLYTLYTPPTTTTIPYILIITMIMITGCSAIQMQTPTPEPMPTTSEPESGAVFEIEIETQTPALCAIVIAEQALHLRAEPSETSQVIGWLKAGEIVNVDSRAGDLLGKSWWKVGAGYARADYLELLGNSETECE